MHLSGAHNRAPVRALARALEAAAPGLIDRAHDWERTTLAVHPLCTAPHDGEGERVCACPARERAGRAGWYEVRHTAPALVTDPDTGWEEIGYVPVGGRMALLPPPPVLPRAARLAATPPPRLALSPAQMAFYGAEELARQEEALHRQAADRPTSTAYDWTGYAARILPLLRTLDRPRPLEGAAFTEATRARLAAARLEVAAAHRSLRDRLAADPARLDRVAASRARLAAAEQEVKAAGALLAHLEDTGHRAA
ncbi:hypothetical protein ACOQFV_24135 [Nocardiopsis changdeensis]|uniref:Uncharacterized protein n=1 Tax=Nocardiopsis changdeensis TaxID=2831969 RepID=A0A975QAP8_9ACTN|nr:MULTISPECIES: hypothetical protein [Nocardiopsis]QUX26516.1 hypothetical protein KGD84_32990 [Nocardiopsis changdeensis]QYX40788.1 hypothetical protein K1J57_32840 [Nocardiopsis sp. MT53]